MYNFVFVTNIIWERSFYIIDTFCLSDIVPDEQKEVLEQSYHVALHTGHLYLLIE